MAEQPEREVAFMKIVITKDIYQKLNDFKDKWSGQKVSDVKVRVNVSDVRAIEVELTMSEFLEALGLEDANELIKPCDTCGGSGEVSTMEAVYPGESHTADIGSQSCPDCSGHDDES